MAGKDADAPYWRILIGEDHLLVAVELQWFDETDYDQSKFIDEKRYDTEEAANGRIHVLNTHLGRIKATQGGHRG